MQKKDKNNLRQSKKTLREKDAEEKEDEYTQKNSRKECVWSTKMRD